MTKWKVAAVAGAAILAGALVSAQDAKPKGQPPPVVLQPPMDTSSKPWTGKFLPDGQPDVHGGMWNTSPAGNSYFTNPQVQGTGPDAGNYKPQPSRVIDPPDGMIPYQPWALQRQQEHAATIGHPEKPEDWDPQGQCLSGLPKLHYYISPYTILQSPGYLTFAWEHYHLYQVIAVNGTPHVGPTLKFWMGDSRGHWEGNTLVVDTTGLNNKARFNLYGDFASNKAHFEERFVFLSADRMIYELTIDDPSVYTRPWTIRVDNKRVRAKYEIWEDSCVEGQPERPSEIPVKFN